MADTAKQTPEQQRNATQGGAQDVAPESYIPAWSQLLRAVSTRLPSVSSIIGEHSLPPRPAEAVRSSTSAGLQMSQAATTPNFSDIEAGALAALPRPELEKRISQTIESLKSTLPKVDANAVSDDWAHHVVDAFDKNRLPLTRENLGYALSILAGESGFRTTTSALNNAGGPGEDLMRSLSLAKPTTSGPMETLVRYVMKEANADYDQAYQLLQSPDTGVRYGVGLLKDFINRNRDIADPELRARCVFADYDAGIYASRNAGFQAALNRLTGAQLKLDGSLLLPGNPPTQQSETEKTVQAVFDQRRLGLGPEQIREDLAQQLSPQFTKTATWNIIKQLADGIDPVPAERPIRSVSGTVDAAFSGPKSSREYSDQRYLEYQAVQAALDRQS